MRSRVLALLCALALVGFVNSTHHILSAPNHTFDPGCPIPYASIAQHRPIDDACDRFGESGTYQPSSQAHRESNAAKNNLCAVGPAIPLAISDDRRRGCWNSLRTGSTAVGQERTAKPDHEGG